MSIKIASAFMSLVAVICLSANVPAAYVVAAQNHVAENKMPKQMVLKDIYEEDFFEGLPVHRRD